MQLFFLALFDTYTVTYDTFLSYKYYSYNIYPWCFFPIFVFSNRLTSDIQDFKSSFKLCISQGLRAVTQVSVTLKYFHLHVQITDNHDSKCKVIVRYIFLEVHCPLCQLVCVNVCKLLFRQNILVHCTYDIFLLNKRMQVVYYCDIFFSRERTVSVW